MKEPSISKLTLLVPLLRCLHRLGSGFFIVLSNHPIDVEEDPIVRDFAIIPRAIIQSQSLSITARMILIWLLSKSRSWEARMDNLQKEFGIGRDSLRKAFKELESQGYAELQRLPNRKDGTFGGMRWKVYRSPHHPPPENPSTGTPTVGKSGGYNESKEVNENREIRKQKVLTPNRSASPLDYGEDIRPDECEDEQSELATDPNSSLNPLGATRRSRTSPHSGRPLRKAANYLKPMTDENPPTEEEFSCFVQEECPRVAKTKPSLYEVLVRRNWRDKRFLPIRDWRQYVLALEEMMN